MKGLVWVALLAGLVASPVGAQTAVSGGSPAAGCDPEVEAALLNAASSGVEKDLTVIRHQDEGIGDPDSIFDMDCDFFRFPEFDALVSLPTLGDLIDALKRRACSLARNAWNENVGRKFDRRIYDIDGDIDRLPGLGSTVTAVDGSTGSRQGAEVFRRAIGGEGKQ